MYARRRLAKQKPWRTCFLDVLAEIPYAIGRGPWQRNDIDAAIKSAKRVTGLSDLGGDGGVGMLLRYQTARRVGLEKSKAKYSPAGFAVVFGTIHRRIVTRLRFVDFLKKHPSVEKVIMRPPVFVIGFPRTGTTFLHELLGLHPGVRMHYSWEQMDPVPYIDLEDKKALTDDRARRYAKNKGTFNWMLTLAGDAIQHIHRFFYSSFC